MTKTQKAEQADAITKLREWIKPGDTVYTVLDHVSSSGMSRHIRVVLLSTGENGKPVDLHPNYSVGKALGLRHARRYGREQDALLVGGCGMDMGFHIVYELSHTLFAGRLVPDIYLDSATHDQPGGQLLTREGAPEGKVYLGGYKCLGKGLCPSNYHSNHHDTVQCWTTSADDEPRCYWERGVGHVIGCSIADPERIPEVADQDVKLCPKCKGTGRLPNPDGPQRFDLVHTDGYALRHRWL